MHLLAADGIGAAVESRPLFSGASFSMRDGDHVGVVGPNGAGKSTLLRIVAGRRQPDRGAVIFRRDAEVAFLEQEPRWPEATAIEAVVADPRIADHEAHAMLDRLSIDADAATSTLSEGQRRRVALARVLLAPADLLVLDEPTNHLDVETIEWLEATLTRRRTAVLFVTHDRYVLERLATRMLDIEPQLGDDAHGARVIVHDGTYSSLLEARANRIDAAARQRQRAQRRLQKEVAWLRRQPRARTSKPKFRAQQVERLRLVAADDAIDAPLELGTGRRRLGNEVLNADGVTLRRASRRVLDDVSLTIGPGDRVGIVGPNGAGKTTLLDVLTGQLRPDSGRVSQGSTVVLGRFTQDASVPVDGPNDSVLDSLRSLGDHLPLASGETVAATRIAERFGFAGDLLTRPVALLSGGERRRLALLHVLLDAPNVLVFDEPSNDLDLDTLVVLEDYLDGFAGTLLVASHDRYLLDRLTDRIVAIEDGHVTHHLDVADFHAARNGTAVSPAPGSTPPAPRAVDNRTRQARRRKLRALEQRVDVLSADRRQIHDEMAGAAREPDALVELQRRLADVEADLARAEQKWLELAEIDEAES